MKKVLLVFPGIEVNLNDGAKHRLNCFIEQYKENGAEIDVLAFVKDWPHKKELNENAHWFLFPYILPLTWSLFFSYILIGYMSFVMTVFTWVKHYDVVQMEVYGIRSKLCRRCTKYIVDLHGDLLYERIEIGKGNIDDWCSALFRKLQKQCILNSDLLICVSENLKKQIEINTNTPIKDYSIISCGVNYERFMMAHKANVDINLDDRLVVGYSGGLNKWQNIDKILNIVKRMLSIDKRVYFALFTNGKLSQYEHALSEIGEKNVMIKALTPLQIPNYTKILDGGFLLRDNLILNIVSSPTKIGEYLASGAALICTPYSGDYKLYTEGHDNCYVLSNYSDEEIRRLLDWLWEYKRKQHSASYLSSYSFSNQFKHSSIIHLL